MNLQIDEVFSNLKNLPPIGTEEYEDLVEWEIKKLMGGVHIDGVFFSGFLYWHLFHWHIIDDYEDEYGNILRNKMRASLRDNEWEVAEYLERCRVERVGYMHIGARQFGKSELMASYLAYHATLFQNTQNVIVGGNDDDLQMLRAKIDFGIKHLWEGLKIPKLDKDLKKNMVRLGFKHKGGEDEVWSWMIVRNVAGGNNTEGPAGVTAKAFALDECGKFSFAQSYEAAKPAFKSKFGWRCVPLVFGTGGSFDKGADAERFFYHPEANGFLGIPDPDRPGKSTAIFFSGLYRIDCKYNTTLADYLIKRGDIPADHDVTNLIQIPMAVSDKVKAEALIKQERAEKANDPDRTEYLKLIMYYPLTPKECFLTSAENYYNGGLAKAQQLKLDENNIKAQYYELSEDGEKIIANEVLDRVPISSYPTKKEEDLNAPIQIWEHPIPNPPYGLYVAGVDPYKFDQAASSGSLGAIYIFKRMHDVLGETYQDCFVASYVARPERKLDWNKQALLLMRYYNAQTLVENDEPSFCDWVQAEGYGHLLEDQPSWIKDWEPNTKVNRPKGISRASEKIRKGLRDVLKTYMEEKITNIRGTNGEVIGSVLGISQIYDRVFLEEIANWNEDGNFDREVAASIAVAQAMKMDKVSIVVNSAETDERLNAVVNRKRKYHPFDGTARKPTHRKRKSGKLF